MKSALGLLFGFVLIANLGCRDPNLPELYPVTGTVTLDGEPLARAGVMFLPRGTTRGNACIGITDENGKYSLTSERDGGEGAPEGEFAVTISKMKEPVGYDPSQPAPAETGNDETLASQYWDSSKTVLTAKVPKGGGNIDFPLKSKGE